MTWNYRVMRHTDSQDGEPYLRIHGVFYDVEDGKKGWSEPEATPLGSDIAELRQSLEWMTLALDKPVLDYETGEEVAAPPTTPEPPQ